jgi:hypothetical protein
LLGGTEMNKRNKTGHNDIVEARRFIFEQMVALSKGKISIQEGIVQAKLAHQLMDGYKTQVRAMEIMNAGGSEEDAVKMLDAVVV